MKVSDKSREIINVLENNCLIDFHVQGFCGDGFVYNRLIQRQRRNAQEMVERVLIRKATTGDVTDSSQ